MMFLLNLSAAQAVRMHPAVTSSHACLMDSGVPSAAAAAHEIPANVAGASGISHLPTTWCTHTETHM